MAIKRLHSIYLDNVTTVSHLQVGACVFRKKHCKPRIFAHGDEAHKIARRQSLMYSQLDINNFHKERV